MSLNLNKGLPELNYATKSEDRITFTNQKHEGIERKSKFSAFLSNISAKIFGVSGVITAKVGQETIYLDKKSCENYLNHHYNLEKAQFSQDDRDAHERSAIGGSTPGLKGKFNEWEDHQIINLINMVNKKAVDSHVFENSNKAP